MPSASEFIPTERAAQEHTAPTSRTAEAEIDSASMTSQLVRRTQRRASGILRAAALALQLIEDGRDVHRAVEDPDAAREMALEVLKEKRDEETRRASSVPPPPQVKTG